MFKNSRCIPEEVSVRSVRASSASVDDRTSDVKRKNGGRKWDLIMNSWCVRLHTVFQRFIATTGTTVSIRCRIYFPAVPPDWPISWTRRAGESGRPLLIPFRFRPAAATFVRERIRLLGHAAARVLTLARKTISSLTFVQTARANGAMLLSSPLFAITIIPFEFYWGAM